MRTDGGRMISASSYRRPKVRVCGTRFRLHPQPPSLVASREPEIVWVSPTAGSIGPGPADDRMVVVDAIGKNRPYGFQYLPPYDGPRHSAVHSTREGHFDHLEPGSRAFMAAHMYGTLRFVLDVWEGYLGGEIGWHFAEDYARLELIPIVGWNNAHCGYGFIETGYARPQALDPQPFCLNFDVLAHELGHAFMYSMLGMPPPDRLTAEYLAYHESAADCVAMIAVLYFDSVVDRLLLRTRGNLYLPNELNRIGELSETEQIRLASHSLTLDDVPDLRTPVAALSYPQRHDMGLPMTGAVFDMLVDVFQEILVEDGLISPALDDLSRQVQDAPVGAVQAEFDRAYAGRHDEFKAALLDARDYMGRCLAHTWRRLSWDLTLRRRGRRDAGGRRRVDGRRRPKHSHRLAAMARHPYPVPQWARFLQRMLNRLPREPVAIRRGHPRHRRSSMLETDTSISEGGQSCRFPA